MFFSFFLLAYMVVYHILATSCLVFEINSCQNQPWLSRIKQICIDLNFEARCLIRFSLLRCDKKK